MRGAFRIITNGGDGLRGQNGRNGLNGVDNNNQVNGSVIHTMYILTSHVLLIID